MVPPVLMLSENGIFPIFRICGSIFLRLGTVICLQADRTSMSLRHVSLPDSLRDSAGRLLEMSGKGVFTPLSVRREVSFRLFCGCN